MNRRSFMKNAGAAGLVSAHIGPLSTETAKPATNEKKPSHSKGRLPRQIVFLITDATRKDMLTCYQQNGLQTPNLDRIAAEGVRFERAYTTQPVCTPARSSIFTGLYPHSNGAWGNSMPLGSTVHSVGQRLDDHGVHCAYIGKWHLDGFDYFGTGKPAPGWDPAFWYDQRNYLMELSPEDRQRSRNATTAQDSNLKATFTFAHRCSNRAIDFITKHSDEDFVLVVSYDEPHDPSIAPEKYRNLYTEYSFHRSLNMDDDLKGKPEEQRVWADNSLNKPVLPVREPDYFGALTFVDAEIGRVLDQIDKSIPNAMVMYTSDHGGMLQSHHLYGKGPAMYEGITNIPFLVRERPHVPKNVSSSVPISHIDVTGTMLEYFGMELPKSLEGGSMLSAFRDPSKASRENAFIEWGRYEVDHDGFGGFQPMRCITDGRWKLSIHLLTSDELYDLQTDPGELVNLINAEEHAKLRNRLHDALLNQMDVSRDPFRGYYWGRRAWRKNYPVSWENHGMTRQADDDDYRPHELDYDTGLPVIKATHQKDKGASK
jgi:uncharacterized sulfatase